MIRLQMLARRVNQQVPRLVFGKDGGALVQQEPAEEIKIPRRRRLVDRQGKVPAALGRAVFAQHFPGFQVLTAKSSI
jgi:hypothetical protein